MADVSFLEQTLPVWLGAAGTITAASIAVFLALREGRRATRLEEENKELRDKEERRQAAREAREERAQAERVVGWFQHEGAERGRFRFEKTARGYQAENVKAMVKNASDQPIFDVQVQVPIAEGAVQGICESWEVFPPGEEWSRHIQALIWVNKRPYVHLTFRDSANQGWERKESGTLNKISSLPDLAQEEGEESGSDSAHVTETEHVERLDERG